MGWSSPWGAAAAASSPMADCAGWGWVRLWAEVGAGSVEGEPDVCAGDGEPANWVVEVQREDGSGRRVDALQDAVGSGGDPDGAVPHGDRRRGDAKRE